jgi:uncharacterized membrane protein
MRLSFMPITAIIDRTNTTVHIAITIMMAGVTIGKITIVNPGIDITIGITDAMVDGGERSRERRS